VSPATVEAFRAETGITIRSVFGMTETTSPTHMVPLNVDGRIDEVSGALSVGVPTYNVDCSIYGEDDQPVGPGDLGEVMLRGPQVVPGYWNKPEETKNAFSGGWLRTGDIGFMDDDGWLFIIDRKKDQINVSGYKVWPREVEDGLYAHEAVREAAVVGVVDPYRGESVKAFVSLKPGSEVTPDELKEFCKARMAAYKYPRVIEILDELPKTASGKILRRQLRGATKPAKW
jgi:long-chain acyl-CoA synthetase